jgi:hypothetical protein
MSCFIAFSKTIQLVMLFDLLVKPQFDHYLSFHNFQLFYMLKELDAKKNIFMFRICPRSPITIMNQIHRYFLSPWQAQNSHQIHKWIQPKSHKTWINAHHQKKQVMHKYNNYSFFRKMKYVSISESSEKMLWNGTVQKSQWMKKSEEEVK